MTTTIRLTRRHWLGLHAAMALPALSPLARSAASAFDHSHAAWDQMLRQHVVVGPDGSSSTVRYSALLRQRAELRAYLDSLAAVSPDTFALWSKDQRLAFLVNAYNAWTVELVLTRYPNLKSIKDLGSLLESPWKKKFVRLLGEQRHLDDIEHGLIRAPGAFDDPRIHVAVVCASVGCPMLRNEAFVAQRLDAQLDDAMRRFLSDRSRNRFEPASRRLEVSRVFDWYRKDFERGHRGIDSLKTLFARYADRLADSDSAQAEVRSGRYQLVFLDYDWSLNDTR